MNTKLVKNKTYFFTKNEYFEIIYRNIFIVKSRSYDFSMSKLIHKNHKNESELFKLLNEYKYSGKVWFDLFSPNGYDAENRFIETYFKDDEFIKEIKIIPLNKVYNLKFQNEYYKNMNLKNTVLCKTEIVEFLNKC